MPQPPTLTCVKIRNSSDAQTVLYACYQGVLPMIKSRLDQGDRHALASGHLYIWEERSCRSEPGVGIERFTEGRRWSPSRLRDDFLYYYERYLHLSETDQKVVSPPADWDPFVKQTYSSWVSTPNGERKWHLTAYYTDSTRDNLTTVDDIPLLRDILVPEGHFRTNADVKSKRSDNANAADGPSVPRTYAAFPVPWTSRNVKTPPRTSTASLCGQSPVAPAPAPANTLESPRVSELTDSTHGSDIGDAQHRGSSDTLQSREPYDSSMGVSEPILHCVRYTLPVSNPPDGSDFWASRNFSHCAPPYKAHQQILSASKRSHDYSASLRWTRTEIHGSSLASSQSPDKPEELDTKDPHFIALVPLHLMLCHHTYRRDPVDDKTLRLLGSRS